MRDHLDLADPEPCDQYEHDEDATESEDFCFACRWNKRLHSEHLEPGVW